MLAGDLVVDVRNRELDILMELLSRLRILEPRLRTAAQRLAELDVLLAFTAAALKYQWVTWFKGENHRSGWGGLRFFLFFFGRDFYGNCILFDFFLFVFWFVSVSSFVSLVGIQPLISVIRKGRHSSKLNR